MTLLFQALRKNVCFETNTSKIVDILTKQKNDNQSINQWFICNSPNAQKHNIKFHGKKETIGQSKQKAAKKTLGHRVKQLPILFKNSAALRASY